MGAPEKRNPPLSRVGGSRNALCLGASNTREYNPSTDSMEASAAQFIAGKYRLPLRVARLVCDLARIGARCV